LNNGRLKLIGHYMKIISESIMFTDKEAA